jgi:hypothetical protein
MAAILITAAVTCFACLFVGQAALRICGAAEWSWLAPPVGLSVLMMAAIAARHVPGNADTVAVLLGLVTLAAAVWCLLAPAHRPPLGGLLAAVPVAFLVLIPFFAVGRSGILGVTVDNDMAAHLRLAEIFFTSHPDPTTSGLAEYPVGPHAMSAVLGAGLHVRLDHAFTGWTVALPVLNSLTALALLRRSAWLKKVVVATVVGLPFLVAAYYGEGSFKELAQANLVLACALLLAGNGPAIPGRGRWVPFALVIGGILSVYSVTGLPWPAVFAAIWVIGLAVAWIADNGLGGFKDKAVATVRGELVPLAIALGVLIVFLIPQARRLHNFVTVNFGSNGIVVPKDVLANLVGPLPGWEAFGVWGNSDFRLPPPDPFTAGLWTAFVIALVLIGTAWFLRRGRWMLPLAAAASMLIWAWSIHSQSPYTVAKALVIASPLLLILAVVPLVEQLPDRLPRSPRALLRAVPGQPLSWAVAAALVIVLFLKVGADDVRALRASPVGPTYQADQLRELRPLLHGKKTLFLGDDDFIRWELGGVTVGAPVLGGEESMIRPEKGWTRGEPLDFDTVTAQTLNEYDYVVTTKDKAASQPPPQMHLVGSSQDFQVWQRTGEVSERGILPEGEGSGGLLDCTTPEGKAVVEGGGVAAVRPASVVVPGPLLDASGVGTVELPLVRGQWTIESSYLSRLPIEVTGPGLDVTLQPSLDRPGPRWPVGKIEVEGKETVKLTFKVGNTLFAPNQPIADLGKITATPTAPERIVPIKQACGLYVDWYRGSGKSR